MTTKGDNRKQQKAEAERLRLVRLPQRSAELSLEIAWASGLPTPGTYSPPPPWVRYCVRRYLGIPDTVAHRRKIDAEILARILGEGQGVLAATTAAINRPASDPSHPNAEKIEIFRQRMVAAIQPQLDNLKNGLAAIPEEKLATDIDLLVAMDEERASASAKIRLQSRTEEIEGGITQSILFYLWMFWVEVETAASVAELNRWFADMELVACSQKLLEKVCRMIGLRLSPRGRKRIPTPGR